jgi:hypothetical protein
VSYEPDPPRGWHTWFAWRPVRVPRRGAIGGRWTWLRRVQRKLEDDYGTHSGPAWRYLSEIETIKTACPFCGKPVESLWVPGGGCLARPEYTLIADWIYHTDCWNTQVKRATP